MSTLVHLPDLRAPCRVLTYPLVLAVCCTTSLRSRPIGSGCLAGDLGQGDVVLFSALWQKGDAFCMKDC